MQMQARKQFEGLNLIRVYAIFTVVGCHTGLLDLRAGGIGTKLFFVISGFLAFFSLQGSVLSAEKIDWKDFLKFYWKKILRIVPMYWIVLLAVWRLVPGYFSIHNFSTENSLVLNMLFIKVYGHLWYIQQTMIMYLLAPFIMLLIRGFSKISKSDFTIVIVLCALACLEKLFFTADVLCLSGEGDHQQLQLWIFLLGMALAYDCRNVEKNVNNFKWVADVFSVVAIVGLLACLDTSFGTDALFRTIVGLVWAFLFANSKGSYLQRLSETKAVKTLSDISFGVYLIHFFLLGFFGQAGTASYVVLNFAVSMVLAYLLNLLLKWANMKIAKSA